MHLSIKNDDKSTLVGELYIFNDFDFLLAFLLDKFIELTRLLNFSGVLRDHCEKLWLDLCVKDLIAYPIILISESSVKHFNALNHPRVRYDILM